jgi:hypothetical protein
MNWAADILNAARSEGWIAPRNGLVGIEEITTSKSRTSVRMQWVIQQLVRYSLTVMA